MTIRVVLGEDNMLVREGVRALLDSYDDIDVVGVAEDAPSLLEVAAAEVPDVVVTDIKMPPTFQLEGIDAAHAIRQRHPETGVVVVSSHDDEEYALALLGQGRNGLAYLLKDRISRGDELARAVREVAAGGSVVDPVIAERLSGRRDAGERDRQILDLMARGLGFRDMASELATTPEAVDREVTDLFARLGGGSTSLVDEFKRLHAAVVGQAASRKTLASFVPHQLADLLDTQPEAIEPSEMEVTVLFSDIRGFSTLAEQLPARDVATVVGRHLEAMAEVVTEHGGTIDKFQGDAVMAVFGAPAPLPDHAARAVACALEMQRRHAEMNAVGWGVDGLDELGLGIGINTGMVIAGTVGGAGRLEYTVVGDAVNIASRLQNNAAAGEIVATQSTVSRAPDIVATSTGLQEIKGRAEPVEVFQIARS